MPGIAPNPTNITSRWGTNPKTVIPPQGNPRSPSSTGYVQGVPTTYNGAQPLNTTDTATLSAMPSVFNRVRMYPSLGGNYNIHGAYLNGKNMMAFQNQAGDAATVNTQTVGGSTNGMQTGAGLQLANSNGRTVAVTGIQQPTPPVPIVSRVRNWGNVVSPGTPNIGRPGGPVAGPNAGLISNIINNQNWIVTAIGSAIIAFVVTKYVLK
jgi:hypothetical protein